MGKFVLKTSKEKVYFTLLAKNAEPILASQGYASRRGALKGLASVAKNAPVANVEDQTKEGWEKAKNPKFEVYADKGGDFRFRLISSNGKNIGHSEGYSSMAGLKNGIKSVIKNVEEYEVVNEEDLPAKKK